MSEIKIPVNSEVLITQLTNMQTLKTDELSEVSLTYNTPGVILCSFPDAYTGTPPVPALSNFESSNFVIEPTTHIAEGGNPLTQVDIGSIPAGSTTLSHGGAALTKDGKLVKIKANQPWIVAAPSTPGIAPDPTINIQYQIDGSGWTPAARASVAEYPDDFALPLGAYALTDPYISKFNRNSGNIMVNVILAPATTIINYFWIDYLQIPTQETGTVVNDQNDPSMNWYSKYIDGYQIFVTAGVTPVPPAGHADTAILLGQITVNTTGIVGGTVDYSYREYSQRLANTITGNVGGLVDIPATYANDEDVTLDDHIKAKGNGTVTPTNPHGLTAGDIGVSNNTLRVIASSPDTLTLADGILLVDATAGSLVISLPVANASTNGVRFTFRRIDATINTVTIQSTDSSTIETGATTLLIPINTAVSLVYDSAIAKWWIYSLYNTGLLLGSNGVSGTFTSAGGSAKTITVVNGQITSSSPALS